MKDSAIIQITSKILIPFIIVFGFYVIVNGADSVGGGFQGGAVLSAAFIVRWLISPNRQISVRYMKIVERILLLSLFIAGMLLLGREMKMPYLQGRIWMIAANLIIGVKVACGLTIIFYRFVFIESR